MTDLTTISRDAAVEAGLNRYFTGKPCKHGHVVERHVASRSCCECSKGLRVRWKRENPDVVREYRAAYYAANRDAICASQAAYRARKAGLHPDTRGRDE